MLISANYFFSISNENSLVGDQAEAAPAGPTTTITFDESEYNFGTVDAGEVVEHTYTFTNTGAEPLVISNAKGSCGCTVPQDWSKEPLAPGDSGKFTVKFNGSGKNKVSKTVTVTANTEKGKETVKITAFVKPDPNAVTPAKAAIPQVK